MSEIQICLELRNSKTEDITRATEKVSTDFVILKKNAGISFVRDLFLAISFSNGPDLENPLVCGETEHDENTKIFFLLQVLHGIKSSRVTSKSTNINLPIQQEKKQYKRPSHKTSDLPARIGVTRPHENTEQVNISGGREHLVQGHDMEAAVKRARRV